MKHEKKNCFYNAITWFLKSLCSEYSAKWSMSSSSTQNKFVLYGFLYFMFVYLYICHHAIIISFCLCALGCFHFVEFVSSLLFVHFREQKSITNITTNKNPWKINANKKQKDKASKFEMENVLKRIEHKQNKTFKDFFIHIDWCVQCDICFAGSIIRLSKWKQHKD